MRSRGVLTLLLAIMAGLVAMLMAARWLGSQGGKTHRIAVAAVDVTSGTVLTAEMVKLVDWPPSNVPKGAVLDAKPLAGRVIKTSLIVGEPVLDSRLAPAGSRGGLSAMVANGKRAMTVKVNEVVGVSGFAVPGNYVDVLVNTRSGGGRGNEGTISKIVLERMLVLAVAQEVERDATKPKVVGAVTLEVTPEQAETLDLARNIGTLSLVLRNQNESDGAGTLGATKADVLGLQSPAAAPAAAPRARTVVAKAATAAAPVAAAPAPTSQPLDCVDVIRGMSKTTECF